MRSRYVTIFPDGQTTTREFPYEVDSGEPEVMSWLHSQVGGWIEHVIVVYEGRRRDAYINEEGKLEDLAVNRKATELYQAANGAVDFIAGPIVVEVPL